LVGEGGDIEGCSGGSVWSCEVSEALRFDEFNFNFYKKKTWPFIRDEIFLLVLKFENTSRMFKGFNNAYITFKVVKNVFLTRHEIYNINSDRKITRKIF
jgi:hypothetical protein